MIQFLNKLSCGGGRGRSVQRSFENHPVDGTLYLEFVSSPPPSFGVGDTGTLIWVQNFILESFEAHAARRPFSPRHCTPQLPRGSLTGSRAFPQPPPLAGPTPPPHSGAEIWAKRRFSSFPREQDPVPEGSAGKCRAAGTDPAAKMPEHFGTNLIFFFFFF